MTKIRITDVRGARFPISINGRVRRLAGDEVVDVNAEELALLGDSNIAFELEGGPEVDARHPELIGDALRDLPAGTTVNVPVPTEEGDPEATTVYVSDGPDEEVTPEGAVLTADPTEELWPSHYTRPTDEEGNEVEPRPYPQLAPDGPAPTEEEIIAQRKRDREAEGAAPSEPQFGAKKGPLDKKDDKKK